MLKANATGAYIWEALAKQTPVNCLAGELARRYSIAERQAEQDIALFITELKDAGLVTCAAR
jgi:hypothetical protein